MPRKLIMATLIAAMAVPAAALPTAASAQSAGELRRDRQDIRDQQRDLRDARRYGDRDDIRHERRELRGAREEYREDWRDYRNRHRDLYRGSRFDAPFRYQRFAVGVRIAPTYWGPRYRVADVGRWRLPPAGRGLTYVRHYDDLLLVNTYTGRVVRVYDRFYW